MRILILIVAVFFIGCKEQEVKNFNSKQADLTNSESIEKAIVKSDIETGVVKVYYFHGTRRCSTCKEVEAKSKLAVSELYGDKIPFEAIDSDKYEDHPILKKFDLFGQVLLITNGNKYFDLTTDAFLYVDTDYEKLKNKIKTSIESI